ncbi:MAG: enoyl-CoA hydratase/isomerase family protein [Nitrososphaerota archaeon]|nr:enoyl-CoA hydratase/isomerase family protein [Nitrososphaerota archaeon]
MPYSDIIEEDRDGIRIVKMNRPEAKNAIGGKMAAELLDAITTFARKPDLKALVLTGAGDAAFCAGGDIKEMEAMDYRAAREFAVAAHKLVDAIEGTGKPVVSAVNGLALGAGCDLALACDLCFASQSARFGLPSLRVGVITPFGGMSRLIDRVGVSKAKSMIFTGTIIGAEEAKAIGIAYSVLPASDFLQGTVRQVHEILKRTPAAFALGKKLLVANSTSKSADEEEIELYASCFRTSDQKEGALAFRQKRDPNFTGT